MSAPEVSEARRETLTRDQKLRQSADYLRCYRQGGKKHGALLSLHCHPSDRPAPRLGITASRKVGNAVIRHRCKRRIREIWRRWPRRKELGSLDVVVHVKPACATASFRQLEVEMERLLNRAARTGSRSVRGLKRKGWKARRMELPGTSASHDADLRSRTE
ncbi:MAG: ribonuclease P protein component [Acidobacteriota bacterium]